jgi:DNA-binding transcriptional regulator YdaS (Cro superfamily)
MHEAPRTPLVALEAVIAGAFGGKAARMAEHFKVSDQTVSFWRKGERDGRPIKFPADFCPECERLTREKGDPVTCEELRPDVPWEVLRKECSPGCDHADPAPVAG